MHDFCHGNDKIRDSRSIPVQQTGWRTAWNQTLLRPQVLRLSRTELGMVQGKFLYFKCISSMGFNRCYMILWKPDTTTIFKCFHKEADSKHVKFQWLGRYFGGLSLGESCYNNVINLPCDPGTIFQCRLHSNSTVRYNDTLIHSLEQYTSIYNKFQKWCQTFCFKQRMSFERWQFWRFTCQGWSLLIHRHVDWSEARSGNFFEQLERSQGPEQLSFQTSWLSEVC